MLSRTSDPFHQIIETTGKSSETDIVDKTLLMNRQRYFINDSSTVPMDSLKSILSRKNRRDHILSLEAQIHKAACIESALLNKATELKEEQTKWIQLYDIMNHSSMKRLLHLQHSSLNIGEHGNILKSVKTKVHALTQKEKALIFKATVVRNKQQQLTVLYKQQRQSLRLTALECNPTANTTRRSTEQDSTEIILVE